MENMPAIFDKDRGPKKPENTELIDQLYRQIGKLQVELEWLKKSLNHSTDTLRLLVETENRLIAISRQCSLIGMNRSSYYYNPMGTKAEDLVLMEKIDKIYTSNPSCGSRRIVDQLEL